MSMQQTLTKAVPVVRSVWDDDEFQDRVRDAAAAGREMLAKRRRGAPPPTVLQRAGLTIVATGRALAAVANASGAEPPKQRRGRTLLPMLVVVGIAGAFYTLRSGGAPTMTPTSEV